MGRSLLFLTTTEEVLQSNRIFKFRFSLEISILRSVSSENGLKKWSSLSVDGSTCVRELTSQKRYRKKFKLYISFAYWVFVSSSERIYLGFHGSVYESSMQKWKAEILARYKWKSVSTRPNLLCDIKKRGRLVVWMIVGFLTDNFRIKKLFHQMELAESSLCGFRQEEEVSWSTLSMRRTWIARGSSV